MTDQELLELAAKAVGLNMVGYALGVARIALPERDQGDGWLSNGEVGWSPLADDGCALRLAVKLGLSVTPYPIYEQPKHSVIAEIKAHGECPNAQYPMRYCMTCTDPCQRKQPVSIVLPYADDPAAATRRAIVCAAAAIGAQQADKERP